MSNARPLRKWWKRLGLAVLVVAVAAVSADYIVFHAARQRGLAVVEELGGKARGIGGWPLGEEHAVVFDHDLTDEGIDRLAMLNTLSHRHCWTVFFQDSYMSERRAARVREVLDRCQVDIDAAKHTPELSAAREMFRTLAAELERLDRSIHESRTGGGPVREWSETFGTLQTLSRDETAALLIPVLRDPNPYCRSCAATLLGLASEKQAVVPLIEMLHDNTPVVRYYAALALGRIGDRRAVPPLIEALRDEDCGMRWQVEEALGRLKDPRAVKPLIHVLLAGHDLGTCYGGAPYLIVAAKKPYEPGDDPPPAWALVQIGPPAAKDVADALSADPEWLVARILAETLGRIRPPASEALTVLRTHPQSEVRAAVAKGLGGARDDRAHDALTEALKDPDSKVRDEAASALKENTPSQDRDTSRQPD